MKFGEEVITFVNKGGSAAIKGEDALRLTNKLDSTEIRQVVDIVEDTTEKEKIATYADDIRICNPVTSSAPPTVQDYAKKLLFGIRGDAASKKFCAINRNPENKITHIFNNEGHKMAKAFGPEIDNINNTQFRKEAMTLIEQKTQSKLENGDSIIKVKAKNGTELDAIDIVINGQTVRVAGKIIKNDTESTVFGIGTAYVI